MNFDLDSGNTLGIIGSNGSGKTTLMRILSGISRQTSGRFRVDGKITSLIELGAGFHPDFTGRDNIFMNAMYLGFHRREVESLVPEIIEFSELGDFIEAPVRTYSSGMIVRLGFSVAINMDPDVLLLDEILAVRDLHFQQKCVERIFGLMEQGKTILFCSHNMILVRQVCGKTLWLKDGIVEDCGETYDVTANYIDYQRSLASTHAAVADGEAPAATEAPVITRVALCRSESDTSPESIETGEGFDVRITFQNPFVDRTVYIGITVTRSDNITCFGASTKLSNIDHLPSKGTAVVSVPQVKLNHGEYHIIAHFMDEHHVHCYSRMVCGDLLIVRSQSPQLGVFVHEAKWAIEP